jgi:DNA-binding CsgD family transcriptional regulator
MKNIDVFSEREWDVIKHLLLGKSNKQIALALGVSQSTVEYHLKNVYRKLQVSSRTEAVLRLGKYVGDDNASELGKSTVEIDEKPIQNGDTLNSHWRILMKRLLYIIGSILIIIFIGTFVFAFTKPPMKTTVSTLTNNSPLLTPSTTNQPTETASKTPAPVLTITPSTSRTNEKFLIINQLDYYLSTLDGADSKLIFSAKHGLIAGLSPNQTQFAYFTDNFIYLQNIAEQKPEKLIRRFSVVTYLAALSNGHRMEKNCLRPVPMPNSQALQSARLIFQTGRLKHSSTKKTQMKSVIRQNLMAVKFNFKI